MPMDKRVEAGREDSAVAPATSRLVWLVLLVALIVLPMMLWAVPATRSMIASGWASFAALVEDLIALFPTSLQPILRKGAMIYLTPWLYLLMAAVFIAENILPADRRQRVLSVGMVHDFIAWFVLGGVVRVALVGVLVKGLYWFCGTFMSGLRIEAAEFLPVIWVTILAVMAGDFLNWLHHYIRHKVALFWLFHTIHHSQQEMNMFTDLRVHLVEYVIAKPITILPLYLLGLDIQLAFWLTLILESYTRIYHANLRTNYGPLRYLLVTPQSHRIHHSILPEHFDKNFAVIFSFWDRLFGTQWTNYDEYPPTGVDDDRFPHEHSVGGLRIIKNYLKQLAYPFWMILSGRRCGKPMAEQDPNRKGMD